MKLLDDICGTAVQLSVPTVYRYDGYCCVGHGENMEIGSLIILVYLIPILSNKDWYSLYLIPDLI